MREIEISDLSVAELNRVSNLVVGAAIEVHRTLGPGLLESVYEQCLAWELEQHKLIVERQVELPLRYKDTLIQSVFRLDLLIQRELNVDVMRKGIRRVVNEL